MNSTSFNRYQIPPDFEICSTHAKAALPFNEHSQKLSKCPCCERFVGDQTFSLCVPNNNLVKIGQEIPLYFTYIKVVAAAFFIFTIALVIQYFGSTTLQKVDFTLQIPSYDLITVQIGYVETARWVRFVYFLLFIFLIMLARGYLKKCKYQVQNITNTLSDRSVMLSNVHKQATARDIRRKFQDWDIENIVFTYRVKNYHQCLIQIYQLQKQKIMALKKRESPIRIQLIEQRLKGKLIEAEKIFRTFRVPENQLDIVFLTLRSTSKRDVFLQKYSTNLFARLYYKFCTCCSNTAIKGQHITVKKAPQAEDIDWLNLQYDYWTKKLHRIACYYMCFAILVYGIMFQYEVSIMQTSNFVASILRTVVVFIVNFFIITLLQYTTYEIEKHELNTNKLLSLIRKLTFFVFVNLSMSPLSIYLYYQFSGDPNPDPSTTPFDSLCFSVLTICIGNIFKPLAEYANVQRILKTISFYFQRHKKINCQMTQQEANTAFEPIPFPLASFYSLLLSSILMTSFFLSCFQYLIIVELIACFILYWTSKYMLLKVCKEPTGLKNYIGRLCQRIFAICIYVYWAGDKIMYYCIAYQNQNKNVSDYFSSFGAFEIVEVVIIGVVFLFSSTILAKISRRIADNQDIESSFLLKANRNTNQINSYEDVNAIILLEQQYKKILKAA